MGKLLLFHFRVTNTKLKNGKFNFGLLTRWVNFILFTFELQTQGWKIKKCYFELLIRKMKEKKFSFRSHSKFPYWNEIWNSELSEKDVGILDFVILDTDLALVLFITCTALCYCVFWKKCTWFFIRTINHRLQETKFLEHV